MNRLWAISLCLVVWSVSQGAHGGTLRIGTPIVEDNQYVFPIFLVEDTGEVAALDFQFRYDPRVFVPVGVTAGPVALQANKQVLGRLRDPGEFGILIMGLNDLGINDGEVARITFDRSESADVSATQLRVTNVTFSDGDGVEIPSSETMRSVTLGNGQAQRDLMRAGEERVSKEEEISLKTPSVETPTAAGVGTEETGTTAIFQGIRMDGGGFVLRAEQPDGRPLQGSAEEALTARTAEARRIRGEIPTPVGRLVGDEGVVVPVGPERGSPDVERTAVEPGTQEQSLQVASTRDSVRVDETIESNTNRATDSSRAAENRREAERSTTDFAPNAGVLLGVALAAVTLVALFAARGKLFG